MTTSKIWTPRVERSKDGDVRINLPPLQIILPAALRLRDPSLPPMLGGAAADAWQFTEQARESILDGTIDCEGDSFKMALFLTASDIGDTEITYAGVTSEHVQENGYTTGGISVDLGVTHTTTVAKVDIATDPVWTASGGSIAADFAVIYEVGGNNLVWTNLVTGGGTVTATDGNTLTIAANASGVFTLAGA